MTTVQLAISDADYLRSLRSLLLQDGEHFVRVVNQPSPGHGGVIVVECGLLGDPPKVSDPGRFVVIVPRESYYRISQLWRGGFLQVLFAGDPPATAYLAVLAAELKLGKQA